MSDRSRSTATTYNPRDVIVGLPVAIRIGCPVVTTLSRLPEKMRSFDAGTRVAVEPERSAGGTPDIGRRAGWAQWDLSADETVTAVLLDGA